MYRVVGIDEAGKGPVIGSLFIGFSIINLENGLDDLNEYQNHLQSLGVKDSKQLSSTQRNLLYNKLKEQMDITYAQLTPALIDKNNSEGKNLNQLEIQAIVEVVEKLRPNLIIIDAFTSNAEKFGEELRQKLSFETKIFSENKADVNYPIVAAASIAAKELREQELAEIKTNVHKILNPNSESLNSLSESPVGSGYSSDSKTREFVQNHFDNIEFNFIFRKSWGTYRDVVKGKVNRTIDEFGE